MRRLQPLIVLVVLIAGFAFWQHRQPAAPVAPPPSGTTQDSMSASSLPAFLPPEARDTLTRIARGGPFLHRQDGGVFGNREGLLPDQPRGYYHEYTVETPGSPDRGARRIISGGNPPVVYYYTDDHYRSFRRFEVAR